LSTFIGQPGSFKRTGNRRDYNPPPDKTLLDCLKAAGLATIGVGKIPSIFDFVGITDPLGSSR
jgi:phosphopentomutase